MSSPSAATGKPVFFKDKGVRVASGANLDRRSLDLPTPRQST
jgi:hypothetical protein